MKAGDVRWIQLVSWTRGSCESNQTSSEACFKDASADVWVHGAAMNAARRATSCRLCRHAMHNTRHRPSQACRSEEFRSQLVDPYTVSKLSQRASCRCMGSQVSDPVSAADLCRHAMHNVRHRSLQVDRSTSFARRASNPYIFRTVWKSS